MFGEFKYSIAVISSNFLLCVIALICVGFNVPILMYLYLIAPAAALIIGVYIYQKRDFPIDKVIYSIFAVCFVLFWFNGSLTDYISADSYSYSLGCALFFIIHLVYCVQFPKSKIDNHIGFIVMPDFLRNPITWDKTHRMFSLICAFCLVPDAILVFYVSGGLKLVLAVIVFIGSFAAYLFAAFIINKPFILKKKEREEKELLAQIKKEQGYR